ncbi:MAG: YggT family protein [Clostridiaceae bacterium]|jgi:YggT family protein|nr:YggT family protein [Clostridiaceae bacterium]
MTEKLRTAVVIFFRVIEILIFLRIILSWLPISKDNALFQFLYSVTEPILAPIRNLIARSSFGRNMMFDFSPVLAYLLLGFAERIIILIIARF